MASLEPRTTFCKAKTFTVARAVGPVHVGNHRRFGRGHLFDDQGRIDIKAYQRDRGCNHHCKAQAEPATLLGLFNRIGGFLVRLGYIFGAQR